MPGGIRTGAEFGSGTRPPDDIRLPRTRNRAKLQSGLDNARTHLARATARRDGEGIRRWSPIVDNLERRLVETP